jgi:hypothetical protein
MHLVVGLDGFFIHPYKPQMDAILDLGPCYVRQTVHQELVDAEQGLTGVGNDPMVLKQFVVLVVRNNLAFTHGGKGMNKHEYYADKQIKPGVFVVNAGIELLLIDEINWFIHLLN